MKAEEAKLEKLRRKIADHEMQIVRGQMSVNERDLNSGLHGIDRDDSADSDVLSTMQAGSQLPMLACTAGEMPAFPSRPVPIHHRSVACAGQSLVTDRPGAAGRPGAVQGSLMAAGHGGDDDDSDVDDLMQHDSVELERFDMAGGSPSRSQGMGGSSLGRSEGGSLDLDHEDHDTGFADDDF